MLTAGLGLWIKDSVRFHSVSVGQDHCLALTNLGSVFAWGAASKGRLGLGAEVVDNQTHPTLVLGGLAGLRIREVAAGHDFSYAASTSGTLYAWGCNDSPGLLGVGDTIDRWEPCEVTALREHPVAVLAVQHNTTVVVVNEGAKVFCWGNLEVCGNGKLRMVDRPSPVEMDIEGLDDGERICSAAAGRFHAVIASDAGRVWTWGRGRAGRLGLGKDKEQVKLKVSPTAIAAESWGDDAATRTAAKRVFCQDDFVFATAGDDAVFAWGCNDFPGKLGLGDTKDRYEPTRLVQGDGDGSALPPVAYFTGKLAVTKDGAAYHMSKEVQPFVAVPPGQTVAHVSSTTPDKTLCLPRLKSWCTGQACAAIGRGFAVSDTGQLYSFTMPRTHKAGGAEDPYGAPHNRRLANRAPQMALDVRARVCAVPELTEIHWTSLRAVAGACDKTLRLGDALTLWPVAAQRVAERGLLRGVINGLLTCGHPSNARPAACCGRRQPSVPRTSTVRV